MPFEVPSSWEWTTLENILELVSGQDFPPEKYNANVILSAKYIDPITEREYEIPLYSYWNYGNGKVSSFASTIEGSWTQSWKENVDTKEIFDNMLYTNIPTEQVHSAFIISNETKGTITDLIVKSPNFNKDDSLCLFMNSQKKQ